MIRFRSWGQNPSGFLLLPRKLTAKTHEKIVLVAKEGHDPFGFRLPSFRDDPFFCIVNFLPFLVLRIIFSIRIIYSMILGGAKEPGMM